MSEAPKNPQPQNPPGENAQNDQNLVTIKDQRREIKRLKNALRAALLVIAEPSDDNSDESTISSHSDPMDAQGEDEAGRINEPPKLRAIWDDEESIYRCRACLWEVVDGLCSSCAEECEGYDVNDDVHDTHQSLATDFEDMNSDRQIAPRGTTPLRQIGHLPQHKDYSAREYRALLTRGATPEMCECFSLTFDSDTGIVAYADQDLFDEFSGPGMRPSHIWKIHLGRRVVLDADDLEGSRFIEDLLEEALYFVADPWETVQEVPGVWVTRPRIPEPTEDDAEEEDKEWSPGPPLASTLLDDIAEPTLPIRPNEYTPSEAGSEMDVEMGAPTWHRDHRALDTRFEGWTGLTDGEESDDEAMAAAGDAEAASDAVEENEGDGEGDGEEDSDSDHSTVDSDFDSQEELSGDESIGASR
ncbi:hypothetical protein JAAARDRAFT_198606 [Jaapia argillacea MUCL 33604]|uniref:DUF8191 domain-containing protein n=1 Tax=Jaapia argillacea MUCL 33604 TaxID=933084 RepID=A0A067PLT3_9AGAM|nr:hypothetical protein JAAARDRAFT_198606 [Jaapia argillacea MUCL 33604]